MEPAPSRPEAIETDVAIAGGGPAGIVLGYLLARAGLQVVVLEKHRDFFRDFRGDTIHPSTMELLAELGLLEEFLKLPHNVMERMTLHFGDKAATLADFRHLPVRCPYIAFVPQWDFLDLLAREGARLPGFDLRMQAEVTSLIRSGNRVVGLRAATPQGDLAVRASVVIGADGRHSIVREKGGFAVQDLGAPMDVLWFRIPQSGPDRQESFGFFERGEALILLDRDEYWQCGYLIPKGSWDALRAGDLTDFRRRVERLGRLPEGSAAAIGSWEDVKLLTVRVDRVQDWAQEGLVLIGDAAHAMSPIGGVGINYAIQDAVAAANVLVPALKAGRPDAATLQAIQARRERATARMQRLQVYLQDKVLRPALAGDKPVRAPWFLPWLQRLPILRRIPSRVIGMGFQPEHVQFELKAPPSCTRAT
ncbi:MAG: FAD-dependent oxidoreductase [Planctomycetota bacterium]